MESKLIRDFIYVDSENLYSLYSQVFEGFAEQIASSTLDQISQDEKISDIDRIGKNSFDSRIIEASLQTENKILLDHTYNKLEKKIGQTILNVEDVTKENYKERLSKTFLIKVRGKAEIEDYERGKQFFKNFNKLTEAVAYANISTDETVKQVLQKEVLIEDLERQIKSASGTNKTKLKEDLSTVKDWINPDALIKLIQSGAGLNTDQKFLDYLSDWFDFFYPNGFEITIVPSDQNGDVVFRGIIDTRFLRMNPQYIRALFGNFVSADWVMVGQITYFPGTEIPQLEIAEQIPYTNESPNEEIQIEESAQPENIDPAVTLIDKMKEQAKKDEGVYLRDSVREMFHKSAALDKMFFESKSRVELLMRPLAIYRESEIEIVEDPSPTES